MFSIISDLANEQNPKTVLLIPFFSNHPAVDIYIFAPSSRQKNKNSNKKKCSDIDRFFCFQIRKDFKIGFKKKTEIKEKWSEKISKIENYIKEKKIPNFEYLFIFITELLGKNLSNWITCKTEENIKFGNLNFLFSDAKGIIRFN